MNKEQLQEIEARANAAAPGPWFVHSNDGYDFHGRVDTADGEFICNLPQPLAAPSRRALGEFIAHARSDVPALCAEVERLRDNLAWLAERVISKELCPHSGVCPPEIDCCVRCLREAEAEKAVADE